MDNTIKTEIQSNIVNVLENYTLNTVTNKTAIELESQIKQILNRYSEIPNYFISCPLTTADFVSVYIKFTLDESKFTRWTWSYE